MPKRNSRLLLALLAVTVVVISITGITFSLHTPRDGGEAAFDLQVLRLAETTGTDPSALRPGETAEAGMAFRNGGEAPCYLRVKLCVPTVEDREVLQPGISEQGVFRAVGSTSEKNDEYWTREGEYICYKNSETGDLLLPGKNTAALYSAVRMNPEVHAELLPKGMAYEIHALAQTAPAAEEAEQKAWKTQELQG